jgi:FkbM family methyltransferase
MMFVSYAQNFEDVMLWRALKHIQKGTYIDVGAHDPEIHSVTKAFYDRGWRGLNLEPVAEWFAKLQAARPQDINLQVAAGARSGTQLIYEIPRTGLSTSRVDIAMRHGERGYSKIEQMVAVETLTSLCEMNHVEEIHFLKVDVEGAERDVITGFDLARFRPWIMVIESTLPMTQTEAYRDWEEMVLSAEYRFGYFDGLNRYYIAHEHEELLKHFDAPPNVFDEFVLATERKATLWAEAESGRANVAESRLADEAQRARAADALANDYQLRAAAAEADLFQLRVRVGDAEQRAEYLQQRALAAEAQAEVERRRALAAEGRALHLDERAAEAESLILAMRQSNSWRVTAPLRWISERTWRRMPASTARDVPSGSTEHEEIGDLTPQARRIYSELRRASSSRSDGR